LGINTVTPSNTLDIHFAGTGASIGINNTAGNPSTIVFANTGTNKWRIGNSATNSFDIFNNALGSNAVSISTASNSVSFLASIKIQQGAGFAGVAGYNGIGCDAGGFFFELGTSTNNPYFNFIGLTGARTYTFPDATGTLALISNLSSYLPLSGGTLTGALSGTSATFSGNLNLPYGSVINWNATTNQYITADSNNLYLGAANFSRITIATTGVVTITNLAGTGSRAVLADASGNLSAPVSDETVKENVQSLKYGLNAIMQLNPISFEYIDEYKNYGEGLQIGNIAQDVEKIIPEAVFTTPSTGLKGINYNQFDGIYIKAIQDLNNIINGLLQRIELLENK